ncbi:hypothetical protein Pint_31289 [Pistacia integerrima]|uniref:Uncharacterized protein n=1 Tax=Pistacia integerrima TaxID=434235 RepID=A0ACC0XQ57_9ROSI|nr:hypothetical protein Pint_31289 [Pistacia integerrima]
MIGILDIVIVFDQQEEYTSSRKCWTLKIVTTYLIDTNCNFHLVDISILANDDVSTSSICFIHNYKLIFRSLKLVLVLYI